MIVFEIVVIDEFIAVAVADCIVICVCVYINTAIKEKSRSRRAAFFYSTAATVAGVWRRYNHRNHRCY